MSTVSKSFTRAYETMMREVRDIVCPASEYRRQLQEIIEQIEIEIEASGEAEVYDV